MSKKGERRQIMGSLLPYAKKPKVDPTASMSFLDHLEELRWRIIKGILGLVAGIVIAFVFSSFIMEELILGPTEADFFMYRLMPLDAIDLDLQSRRLVGQFFAYWGSLIVAGLIIGSPILFYQFYAFIEPALESREKIKTFMNVAFITTFFLLGVSFGYLILVPFAVQFFAQFVISDVIINLFDIYEYLTSVSLWVLSCGILFQIPVISYYLSRAGFLTPEFLRQYRRHAIIAALILSAVLTPPDPLSQIIIAIPLVVLYQFSIYLSKVANRRRDKAFEKAMHGEDYDI